MARNCVCCGHKGMTRFEREDFTIEHRGLSAVVKGLSGWRCEACGEVEFDRGDGLRYAEISDELVMRSRAMYAEEIRRIRKKLKLTQVAASRLTGGGPNAFSRYERGEAQPLPAVVNLFRLLDKHPDLLQEVTEQSVRGAEHDHESR